MGAVSGQAAQSFYEAVGGESTIAGIVARFYAGVADDPVLRPLYPDADLSAAERRLRMFLVQYWGGPTAYQAERGHPRLRMRHAPFAVTHQARERWLAHFRIALDEAALPPELDARFWEYVQQASLFLVNTQDDPAPDRQPARSVPTVPPR
ncbi:MAG: globin [Nocardioidaceae bacterium]|nr:globin [Nocardioidaceae bacterium]